jgi:phosphoserine phosphatase
MPGDMNPTCTRILLVRHGETDWNRTRRFQGRSDLPLNQKGRDQAHALALALKEEPLAAIYSSPLARAMETANVIKVFHPLAPLFAEQRLLEMNLGDLEGMEGARWAEEYPDFRKAWLENPESVSMPRGESLREVQDRAVEALKGIIGVHPPGSTLLLCSHSFVNLTLLCHGLKIPLSRIRELRQETAALNILYQQGQRLWTGVVNERSHLEKYGAGDVA